jgi:hypothetical protein
MVYVYDLRNLRPPALSRRNLPKYFWANTSIPGSTHFTMRGVSLPLSNIVKKAYGRSVRSVAYFVILNRKTDGAF